MMPDTKPVWRKGRGKLGLLDPLLGDWEAEADSPQGLVRCVRSFSRVLGGKYVRLDDTIRSFLEVLDGKHDDLPEQAFYLVGGIDDVLARAEELKATA
jgi:hypothetical protein